MVSTVASALTEAETQVFFTGKDYMAISARTVEALKEEGIEEVKDLGEFKKDDLKAIFSNFKKPPQIADAKDNTKMVDQAPFQISAKSQKRLIVAAKAVRSFTAVGREITSAMMKWTVLSNFETQWDALQERKKQDETDAPKAEVDEGDVGC